MNDEVYMSPNVWKIFAVSYMHYTTIGVFVCVAVGLIFSLLFPEDREVDPSLLTPCIRKLVRPNYTVGSNKPNDTMTDDYTLVSQDTRL